MLFIALALFGEGFGEFDRPVALGLFEHLHQTFAVLGEVVGERLVVGTLQGQHDLRFGRHVVLDGDVGRGERRVFDDLEDVAVVGDHA